MCANGRYMKMDEKCFYVLHILWSAKLAYFLFYKSERISVFFMTEKKCEAVQFTRSDLLTPAVLERELHVHFDSRFKADS